MKKSVTALRTSTFFAQTRFLEDLRQENSGPDDRTRDQLRKKGNEKRQIEKAADRREPPPIDIDGVTHRLESVERDAVGQDDLQRVQGAMQAEPAEEARAAGNEEVEIFEEAENPEVHHQADHEPAPAAGDRLSAADTETDGVIHARGAPEHHGKPPPIRKLVPLPMRDVIEEKRKDRR